MHKISVTTKLINTANRDCDNREETAGVLVYLGIFEKTHRMKM